MAWLEDVWSSVFSEMHIKGYTDAMQLFWDEIDLRNADLLTIRGVTNPYTKPVDLVLGKYIKAEHLAITMNAVNWIRTQEDMNTFDTSWLPASETWIRAQHFNLIANALLEKIYRASVYRRSEGDGGMGFCHIPSPFYNGYQGNSYWYGSGMGGLGSQAASSVKTWVRFRDGLPPPTISTFRANHDDATSFYVNGNKFSIHSGGKREPYHESCSVPCPDGSTGHSIWYGGTLAGLSLIELQLYNNYGPSHYGQEWFGGMSVAQFARRAIPYRLP